MSSAPAQFLEWDTTFFGVRIARLQATRLTSELIAAAAAWCQAERITCLYFLADSDDPATLRLAPAAGYDLVDVRVEFSRALPAAPAADLPAPALPPGVSISLSTAADIPALAALARVSHQDTRFFTDPHFGQARAADLYATWITRSCQGYAQWVWVAHADGAPIGCLTAHGGAPGTAASLGLVTVAAPWQGRGVGLALLHTALNVLAHHGCPSVTVATQGRNVGAQRLYQRGGFRTSALRLWYHRWWPTDPPPVTRRASP